MTAKIFSPSRADAVSAHLNLASSQHLSALAVLACAREAGDLLETEVLIRMGHGSLGYSIYGVLELRCAKRTGS